MGRSLCSGLPVGTRLTETGQKNSQTVGVRVIVTVLNHVDTGKE